MTLATPNGARRHIHKPNGRAGEDSESCPWCGSSISRGAFDRIQNRIAEQERARVGKIEKALKDQLAREVAKVQAGKKAEIERAQKAGAAVAEKKLKLERDQQAATITAERQAAAKKLSAATLEHASEKLKLEMALADVQRRLLAAKPAHAIAEPSEADLHRQISAMLAESSPEDRVSRVARGVRGADVIVEVVHHGEVAGKIIVESKAHAKWQSAFIRRLRENVIRENAAFGILSSTVFPVGAPQQLALVDGCIVASPERVPTLVSLLRKIVVDNFVQKLGAEAKDEKAARLYTFVLSPQCDELFDALLRFTRDLTALDTAEARAHTATWQKRADLVKGVISIREQFVTVVADIIGGGL